MKGKTFFFLFLGMIMLAMPIFAPAVVQVGDVEYGLDIRYTPFNVFEVNKSVNLHYHVFNRSNGLPIIEDVVCYLHIYNQNQSHTYIGKSIATDDVYDYEFLVDAMNFSELGSHSKIIQCNDSMHGGWSATSFLVNTNGKEDSEHNALIFIGIMLGLTLALLGAAALFAYFYANADIVNKFLRILFLGASLLFIISAFALQSNMINDKQQYLGSSLSSITDVTYDYSIWIFRIVMTAIIIYLIYASAHSVMGKKIRGVEERDK